MLELELLQTQYLVCQRAEARVRPSVISGVDMVQASAVFGTDHRLRVNRQKHGCSSGRIPLSGDNYIPIASILPYHLSPTEFRESTEKGIV